MRPLLLIWLLLYLTGCSQRNEKNKTNKAAATIDTTFHLINAFGHVSGDTSKFWELNCGLYLNNKGILAFKAVDNSYRMDTTGKGRPLDVYLTTIYNADST